MNKRGKNKHTKERIKFISYDGEFPCLCGGRLILEVDGNKIIFKEDSLESMGCHYFEGDEFVTKKAPWKIIKFPMNFPEELKEYALEIVNENIKHGCCGGCL